MKVKRYNEYINESIDSTVSTFLLDFGMFITMNLVKSESLAIDENAKRELSLMLSNIRKPIINGMSYSELLNNMEAMRNPKIINGLFKQVDSMIKFIEPRIERFVKESENKTFWLKKISELKDRYKICINKI